MRLEYLLFVLLLLLPLLLTRGIGQRSYGDRRGVSKERIFAAASFSFACLLTRVINNLFSTGVSVERVVCNTDKQINSLACTL